MTPFFVLINGFEARVRVQVRVQSLTRASKQLGNVTVLQPLTIPAARDWLFSSFFRVFGEIFFRIFAVFPGSRFGRGLAGRFLKSRSKTMTHKSRSNLMVGA